MLETEPIELVGTLNVGQVSKGTKNYQELVNKPSINNVELNGNKTSQDLGLQPAGNYLTNESDPTVPSHVKNISQQDVSNWNNKSDFSGNYNDLTNKPNIPTKTSDLTNDSNFATLSDIPDVSDFITRSVNDLTNYYLKSETYTQAEVNNLIGAIQQFHYEIVQTLPTTGLTNVLYLVPKLDTQTQNVYDEYVYANNNWEKIGDTEIDLSGYVTTTQLNTALADYTTTANLTTLLANKQNNITSTNKLASDLIDDTNNINKFVTSAEKTTWNSKQNVLTFDNTPTQNSTNPVTSGGIYSYINGIIGDINTVLATLTTPSNGGNE